MPVSLPRHLLAGALLPLALVVAGCGGGADDPAATTTGSGASSSSSTAGALDHVKVQEGEGELLPLSCSRARR